MGEVPRVIGDWRCAMMMFCSACRSVGGGEPRKRRGSQKEEVEVEID